MTGDLLPPPPLPLNGQILASLAALCFLCPHWELASHLHPFPTPESCIGSSRAPDRDLASEVLSRWQGIAGAV